MDISYYEELSESLSNSLSLIKELDLHGFRILRHSDGNKIYFYKNAHQFTASVRSFKKIYKHLSIGFYSINIPILSFKSTQDFDDSFLSRIDKTMKIPPSLKVHFSEKHDKCRELLCKKKLLLPLKKAVELDNIPDKIVFYFLEEKITVDFLKRTVSVLEE